MAWTRTRGSAASAGSSCAGRGMGLYGERDVDTRIVRVWVNKSGKWNALLHQGTTIVANPSPVDAPAGVEFPIGFINFEIASITPGAASAGRADREV
jgi:hypothetical protein